MENNVKHFTLGPSDENTYGWPWNEVVKKYLESGYASEQKECQVTIREKEYKILKRDAVTVFYDADGNTLFDVTNDRLKSEYESDQGEEEENEENSSLVEMGTTSLADAVTGNIPAPTPEEVETAKKANDGDVLAKAKQKLEEEVKKAKDKEFADPIIRHLLKRCEEDPGMAEDIVQDHKTWLKCFAYIRGEARKRADGNCAVVRDDLVYEWAEDYFRLDDKALEEKKEKERKEQEEKRKAEAAKRKSESGKQKKKTDTKKDNREKKPSEPEKKIEKAPKSKEPEGQMSLFDLL